MDIDEGTSSLLEIERRGWDSLCDGTGGEHYGRLMTADAAMVLADGSVLDRDAVVRSLQEAPPWRGYHLDDVRLVDAGTDSAVLVYRGTARRDPDEPAFVAVMASVYRRVEGRWRLALYQQTPVPQAG